MFKKRNRLLFTPTQFASCIESGLNIHVLDVVGGGDASSSSGDTCSIGTKASLKRDESLKDEDPTVNVSNSSTNQHTSATTAFTPVLCTNGAMEALCQCQSAFLSLLSTSLGDEMKNKGGGMLTEHEVMSCMSIMGLSDLASRGAALLSSSVETQQQQQPPKKKRKGISTKTFGNVSETQLEELVAEQERLLLESACRVRMMMNSKRSSEL
jgi:hypothetical protein